jgi:hypothetical protein
LCWVGRHVRVAEEEGGDGVFRRVHPNDLKPQDAGTNRQASLVVPDARGCGRRQRQSELLGLVSGVGREVRGSIHPEGSAVKLARLVLQVKDDLGPQTQVPGCEQHLGHDRDFESAHQ